MLKFRIIYISFLFLLLAGMNSSVRASVNVAEELQTADTKSKGDAQDHESEEIITHLDFFSAFSLVNVQLQWRDLHIGLNDEVTNAESSANQKERSIENVEWLSLDEDTHVVSTPVVIPNELLFAQVSLFSKDEKLPSILTESKQRKQTINYIQNSGTYPTRC